MSVVIRDPVTSSNGQRISNGGAALVANGPSYTGTLGGHYFAELSTNLATVISAATQAGAGHIGQFRWGSTTKTAFVDYMRITFASVTDFTTLQRISIEARKSTAHTATATGGATDATNFMGTIATLTTPSLKLRAGYPDSVLTDFRMSDTADLTAGAGARVYGSNAIFGLHASVPSAGATTDQLRFTQEWKASDNGSPIELTQDTGICLVNRILWGAAGTATVSFAIGWREILNADVIAV
jgi:hypothetical protein